VRIEKGPDLLMLGGAKKKIMLDTKCLVGRGSCEPFPP
jgi:hypothetical protein